MITRPPAPLPIPLGIPSAEVKASPPSLGWGEMRNVFPRGNVPPDAHGQRMAVQTPPRARARAGAICNVMALGRSLTEPSCSLRTSAEMIPFAQGTTFCLLFRIVPSHSESREALGRRPSPKGGPSESCRPRGGARATPMLPTGDPVPMALLESLERPVARPLSGNASRDDGIRAGCQDPEWPTGCGVWRSPIQSPPH